MKFQDRPIQHKISVMTLIVVAIPLMIFYITITVLYNNAFEKRSNQEIKESLSVMSDRIDRVINDGVLCSNYLTLNLNLINQEQLLHQVDIDNRVRSLMNQSILIFEGIDSIVYVDRNDNLFSTNYELSNKRNEILASSYFDATKQKINGNTTLFDKTDTCMQRSDSKPVVTLGKRIVDIKTGDLIGYLFINLDVKTLEYSMQHEITQYFLYDSSNNSIADTGLNTEIAVCIENILDSVPGTEMEKVSIAGRKYLMSSKKLEEGWTLVGVTDLAVYNITALQLFRAFFIAGLLTVCLLAWLSIKTSGMLTKPLSQLKDGAEEIANGNLNVKFHFKTKDEIGRMGDIFNHMTQKLRDLISLVEEEAKKKRAYELALVQQQVKPHFLYNTLDIIIMLIEMNRSRDAQRVTKKLADYYKNSLSSSAEIITLEREIRIIEDYLDLQLMRYQDKFTYEIDVDSTLSEVNIPKLTLQPLIENAIYHGLKYKEGWGNIFIGAQTDASEQNIIITVSDNGAGMKPEILEGLLNENEQTGVHFGVYSVYHRLKLYYGELCDMKIESEEGTGTTFTITIPRDWREEQ